LTTDNDKNKLPMTSFCINTTLCMYLCMQSYCNIRIACNSQLRRPRTQATA